MNVSIILSLLVQIGVCAPVDFTAQSGGTLTVLVCPIARAAPAQPPAEPETPPKEERAL